jgi:hypothetical protein
VQLTEDNAETRREELDFIYRLVNDALKDYQRGPNAIINVSMPCLA